MSNSVNFTINYIQFLDEEGNAIAPLPPCAHNGELLKKLYATMVKTRLFDAKAVRLQRIGKLGTYPSTLGQEAVSVGYGSAMAAEDVMVPYYRDYGAQFWRGVSMTEILRYWGGDERGNNFANTREDFPIAVPIASQLLHAVGVAKAFQYRQQKRVVVTSVGDGGTSEGDFYEAINLAGVWNLPVVFVIINNQWAISVPRKSQTACQTIAQKAIAGGFSGEQIDGNDILATYHSVENAIQKARHGQGPHLIEMITYRLCDHTTADDAKRYCPADELEVAWKYEPIKRLYNFMTKQGFWDEKQEEKLQSDCKADIEEAVNAYLSTPLAGVESIFDSMYATLPQPLKEQREYALRYQPRRQGHE